MSGGNDEKNRPEEGPNVGDVIETEKGINLLVTKGPQPGLCYGCYYWQDGADGLACEDVQYCGENKHAIILIKQPSPLATASAELAEKGTPLVADVRTFESGATRDSEVGKLDYEAFNSPLVDKRYAQYLHKHREQSDGELREGDNWVGGMPRPVYAKSLCRHVVDVRMLHRGYPIETDLEEGQEPTTLEDALCAVIFNAKGYLLELLLDRELE